MKLVIELDVNEIPTMEKATELVRQALTALTRDLRGERLENLVEAKCNWCPQEVTLLAECRASDGASPIMARVGVSPRDFDTTCWGENMINAGPTSTIPCAL